MKFYMVDWSSLLLLRSTETCAEVCRHDSQVLIITDRAKLVLCSCESQVFKQQVGTQVLRHSEPIPTDPYLFYSTRKFEYGIAHSSKIQDKSQFITISSSLARLDCS